jgi:protein phosphatase
MISSLQMAQASSRAPRSYGNHLFEARGLSHVGLIRVHNEDSWLVEDSLGLAIVADGVGGHLDGALASRAAVECVASYLRRASAMLFRTKFLKPSRPVAAGDSLRDTQERLVARAIGLTNRRLLAVNGAIGDSRQRRGSTIVGLWAPRGAGSPATVFHVGDSRMYLLRDGALKSLTRDHSAYQQWTDTGKHGSPPPKSHILQALGLSNVTPDIASLEPYAGDRYLLCSDGLTNTVQDDELKHMLAAGPDLDTAIQRLVSLGLARGASDNLTIVLCSFPSEIGGN